MKSINVSFTRLQWMIKSFICCWFYTNIYNVFKMFGMKLHTTKGRLLSSPLKMRLLNLNLDARSCKWAYEMDSSADISIRFVGVCSIKYNSSSSLHNVEQFITQCRASLTFSWNSIALFIASASLWCVSSHFLFTRFHLFSKSFNTRSIWGFSCSCTSPVKHSAVSNSVSTSGCAEKNASRST